MQMRIEGFDLPGRSCGSGPNFPGATNIHVAVQRRDRRDELLDPQPGDAASAAWTFDCTATRSPTGFDLKGPYIQGRPSGRFVYLSWGSVDDTGAFRLFRRAKLMLDAIAPDTVEAALASGLLLARLPLTDAKGNPVCAQVRVEWSAAAPS
jgi:hypothetical protein